MTLRKSEPRVLAPADGHTHRVPLRTVAPRNYRLQSHSCLDRSNSIPEFLKKVWASIFIPSILAGRQDGATA